MTDHCDRCGADVLRPRSYQGEPDGSEYEADGYRSDELSWDTFILCGACTDLLHDHFLKGETV